MDGCSQSMRANQCVLIHAYKEDAMSEHYQVEEKQSEFRVIDTRPDDSQPGNTVVASYATFEEAEREARRLNERSLG